MNFTISQGFDDSERGAVAALYWQAFVAKLRIPMGPEHKALHFITRALNPAFALVARTDQGSVAGVAGFKTAQGALIGGGLRDLAASYGWLSTAWRAPLLALVERDLARDVLLMDGICVSADARGHGLGTALLHAIQQEARDQGLGQVRLDVINTNPRARNLYEREGFVAIGQEHLGLLKYVFGFDHATKMLWTAPTQ